MTPKEKLLDWVDDQELDLPARWVLEKLARFADAERFGWVAVPLLMRISGLSERKIRYLIRDLKAAGLIAETDRVHRLENSTRSVPVYKIAPHEERFNSAGSMGARGAPMETHGCTDDGGMGAQGVHPHKEPKEPNGDADASPSGAREADPALKDAFVATEAAYPQQGLGYTNRDAAWAAFLGLAEEGVDVLAMPDAARRFASDPALKRRSYPIVGLDRWLCERRYRGWWAARSSSSASAPTLPGDLAGSSDQVIWDELMAPIRVRLGPALYGSYLGAARLCRRGEDLMLVAATGVGRDWIEKNEWPGLLKAWAEVDPAQRELRLVSKTQFEARR